MEAELALVTTEPETPHERGPWIDAAELLGVKIEPPNWLVKGFIARGDVALLGAPASHGKSLLAIDVALGVATGGPVFGGLEVVSRGRTAFLELEMTTACTQRYLGRVMAGRGTSRIEVAGQVGFMIGGSRKIDVDEQREALMAELAAFRDSGPHFGVEPGLDLIVIDSMRRCMIGDENESGDVARFFTGLWEIRRELGNPAILVLCHFRKTGQNDRADAIDRFRGSSDIVQASDHAFAVVSKHEGRHKIETAKTRERGLPAFVVRFEGWDMDGTADDDHTTPLRFVYEGPAATALTQGYEVRSSIVEYLTARPGRRARRTEIIAEMKGRWSERTVTSALSALKAENIAAPIDPRAMPVVWGLVQPGEDFGFSVG